MLGHHSKRIAAGPLSRPKQSALGVGGQMADALVNSCDPSWQQMMIDRYGDHLTQWERANLARRIQPDDDEAAAAAK